MLKTFIKEKKIRISSLSRDTGIPYSTLNDIINGKTDMEKVSYGSVKRLAGALSLSLSELDELCRKDSLPSSEDYCIVIKNKCYYMHHTDKPSEDILLCKVNALNTRYVGFMAECLHKEQKNRQEVEDIWKDYITSCGKTSP